MKHAASFNINITPATLEKWRAELGHVEEQIKGLEQRRNKLSARIHAVQFFIDEEEPQVTIPGIPPRQMNPLSEDELVDASVPDMGVPEAIRYILGKTKRPMEKAEVKSNLRALGFPMQKLGLQGGYFYTAIGRMQKSGVISREGDRIRLIKEMA